MHELLLAAFDMALELGSRKFAFSTGDLRSRDGSDILPYLNQTYPISGTRPQFTVTKDYPGADGTPFHYMTVLLLDCRQEDLDRYKAGVEKAREILAKMPEGMDDLAKAKYLYRYVATHILYDERAVGYYSQEDWNTLYDALVKECAVCSGYAASVYCLYNLAGIDCLYVSGEVRSETAKVGDIIGHAWNLANINGGWHVFDATWDNTAQAKLVFTPLFFGLSDDAIASYADRRYSPFLEKYAPACGEILDPSWLLKVPPE